MGSEGFDAVVSLFRGLQERADSAQIVNGRLTLTSGTPVTTTDVTSATTVYFTPYNGNRIALYSGTAWQLLTYSELSVAVPSNTTTPFDIFAYNNSGTVALEAVAWTNDTTRATAITLQDGIYVKSGATTRRYLGSGRTTSVSGRCEDSATKRFLFNHYNRISKTFYISASGTGYSYSTGTWRAQNNDTAIRVEAIAGVSETQVRFMGSVGSLTSAGGNSASVGVCEDCTNSYTGAAGSTWDQNYNQAMSYVEKTTSAGYHYYQLVEKGGAGGTFYGAGNTGWIHGSILN